MSVDRARKFLAQPNCPDGCEAIGLALREMTGKVSRSIEQFKTMPSNIGAFSPVPALVP